MKKFLLTERKVENIILFIISIIACVLSILIFTDVLTVKLKVGESQNGFALILLILGLISLGLSIYNLIVKKDNKKGNK